MRLIDADALDMFERLNSYYGDAWRDAQKEIDEALTVDAVPVIRCKDCKYWQFYDLVKANVCKRRYNGHWWTSHEDDFCSRAERKEE